MGGQDDRWGGRATKLTLAILVHVIGFVIGWYLSPPLPHRRTDEPVASFRLLSITEKTKALQPVRRRQARQQPVPPKLTKSEQVDTSSNPLNMLVVSSDVFRSGDIARFMPRGEQQAAVAAAPGESDSSVGEGPGGAKLYNAEWYREPTSAEMDGYMPRNGVRSGYGMIICRTIADYRVEDCRELEEAPQGSGLARAVRLASWQFRVRPPRIGGKPMIGTWVRIRFDMIEGFRK